MMQTRCKCVANMVNAVFTSLLHRGCKCVSKYIDLSEYPDKSHDFRNFSFMKSHFSTLSSVGTS